MIVGEAVFDRDILALDIARVLQALAETAQRLAERIRRLAVKDTDDRHRLLRARDERPRDSRAAEKANEFTSPHIAPKLRAALYPLKPGT